MSIEVAIALESIPPDWYDDDRKIVTMIDVMQRNAERAKRRR